jgi:hypothetical protein
MGCGIWPQTTNYIDVLVTGLRVYVHVRMCDAADAPIIL